MTAKEWKAKALAAAEKNAIELTLPSGMVIQARRPDPVQFAAWDRLPLLLAAAAEGGSTAVAMMTGEQVQETAHFMRDLLIYCCLAPRVSLTPGEDEIHPREIPQEDWTFIMSWAMRTPEAETLRPFRPERSDGGAGDDREGVRAAAVDTAGDRGSGDGAGVRPGSDTEVLKAF